jgi:hypothetical protein
MDRIKLMGLQFLILLLAALACPLGMGAMMWWMQKGMGSQSTADAVPPPHNVEALAARVVELERQLKTPQQVEP